MAREDNVDEDVIFINDDFDFEPVSVDDLCSTQELEFDLYAGLDLIGNKSGPGGRRKGKCKWFNVVKKFGFITPDDNGQDVFVHQSVIQRAGFRSLADGEECEFESKVSGKGIEATHVTGPGGVDCKGRPPRQRKFKCYNCGEYSNHLAVKCPRGPLPKSCYQCHASDHLIKDCALRQPESTGTQPQASKPSSGKPDSDSSSS